MLQIYRQYEKDPQFQFASEDKDFFYKKLLMNSKLYSNNSNRENSTCLEKAFPFLNATGNYGMIVLQHSFMVLLSRAETKPLTAIRPGT